MKQFSCGDVVPNCQATFEAETEGAILALVTEHARVAHDLDPVPDEVAVQVRAMIRDAA
jgi:predicted small metal-binding protein